jgi:hypothetical protein
MYYITPLLVPDRLRTKCKGSLYPPVLKGRSLRQLEGYIESAINHGSTAEEIEQHGYSLNPPVLLDDARRNELCERLKAQQAAEIEAGNWLHDWEPERYDWQTARARVNKILAEYGESLPPIEEQS